MAHIILLHVLPSHRQYGKRVFGNLDLVLVFGARNGVQNKGVEKKLETITL